MLRYITTSHSITSFYHEKKHQTTHQPKALIEPVFFIDIQINLRPIQIPVPKP